MKKRTKKIEKVLLKFKGLIKVKENSYMAICPAHNDQNPSLSITIKLDRILIHCHGGCKLNDVLKEVGLTMKDLNLKNNNKSVGDTMDNSLQHCNGCTMEEYSEAKGISVNFLKKLGLKNNRYGGMTRVKIPYMNGKGEESAIRYRINLEGGDKFRWMKGAKVSLYGLWKLDEAKKKDYVILVEGESDCHTLWYNGFPAIGIPGANNWKEERDVSYFKDIKTIYLVNEPDQGGDTLIDTFKKSSLADKVKVIQLGKYKDPSEMFIAKPKGFKTFMEKKLESAKPLKEYLDREKRELRKELYKKCRDIANATNVLDLLIEDISKRGLVGEEKLVKALYLSLTTRLFERPVSTVIKGLSSSGKSCIMADVLKYFPPEAYYDVTAVSEKALIYSKESYKHRFIIFFEASGMKPGFQEYIMRTLLSEGRIVYEPTIPAEDGNFTTKKIEKEGPTGFITTTTRISLHKENETRYLPFTTTDTNEQTSDVCVEIAKKERDGIEKKNYDYSVWQAYQSWLSLKTNKVKIPYAVILAKSVDTRAVRTRRDVGKMFSLIKAHAILHQINRKKDSDGYIIASKKDYATVYRLIAASISAEVEASVPKVVRETVMAVKKLNKNNQYESVSLTQLAEYLNLDKSAVQRRVSNAIKKGYLVNKEERKGMTAKLELGESMPKNRNTLPTPKDLWAKYSKLNAKKRSK